MFSFSTYIFWVLGHSEHYISVFQQQLTYKYTESITSMQYQQI